MTDIAKLVSSSEVLRLIATLNWKDFEEDDFDLFGGVENEKPMISYKDLSTYVLAGNYLAVYGMYDEEGEIYSYSKAYFLDVKTYD